MIEKDHFLLGGMTSELKPDSGRHVSLWEIIGICLYQSEGYMKT